MRHPSSLSEEEILKKVRRIEISTRRIIDSLFSSQYHTRFKGQGMQFSEFREYYPGDDIRHIDWKVTARTQFAHIRKFDEERDLTIYLMVDISRSQDFGSLSKIKAEALAEVCALLAFGAVKNNDRIGLILFSDRIEKHIPPKKGRSHAMRIVRDLLFFEPVGKQTDLKMALEYYSKVMKHSGVVFLATDFYSKDYDKVLRYVNKKHDLVVLRMRDSREKEIPSIGMLEMQDAETGEPFWVDTRSYVFQKQFKEQIESFEKELGAKLLQLGIEKLDLWTHEDYFSKVIGHFQRLKRKRK